MEIEIIADLIEDVFEQEDIDAETDFYEDLGADWLDMVEIMFACEEEFDVSIGEDCMKDVKTVGDLISLIRRNLGEN